MDIDTALLRTAVVVADAGHVGRAAAELGVTQQAVSQRLAKLSVQLGAPVFERTGRGIRITTFGSALLPGFRRVLEDLDELATLARPETRPLRVDVLDEHLSILRFVIEHSDQVAADPAIGGQIEVVTRTDAASITDWLRSGRADLCFGRAGPLANPWPTELSRGTPVLEPIGVLVGRRHRWYDQPDIQAIDLSSSRLWFPTTGAPVEWRDLLAELSADLGCPIDGSGSTRGAAQFLSDLAALEDTASFWGTAMRTPPPGLRVVPIVAPVPVFPWYPVWRRARDLVIRAHAEAIVACACRAVAEPDPDDSWMPASDRALVDA